MSKGDTHHQRCVPLSKATKDFRHLRKTRKIRDSLARLVRPKLSQKQVAVIQQYVQRGGKVENNLVVFGPQGQCQITFRARMNGEVTVGFRSPVGSDELRAQLNRANRQLWDHEKNRPCTEYQAIEEAAEVLAQLQDLSPASLSEYYATRMYQALRDLLACCSKGKRLETAWTVFEQLQKEAAQNRSPTFFDNVSESPRVRRVKNAALRLAYKLKRPPTKRELRDGSGWTQDQNKEYNSILKRADLGWLAAELIS